MTTPFAARIHHVHTRASCHHLELSHELRRSSCSRPPRACQPAGSKESDQCSFIRYACGIHTHTRKRSNNLTGQTWLTINFVRVNSIGSFSSFSSSSSGSPVFMDAAQSRRVSSAIGERLLQGWTMLNETCPVCIYTPLVRSR